MPVQQLAVQVFKPGHVLVQENHVTDQERNEWHVICVNVLEQIGGNGAHGRSAQQWFIYFQIF